MNKQAKAFKKKYGYVDEDWNTYNTMKKPKETISLEVFRKSGKKGGATTAKRGKKFYKEIGTKGAKVRWANKKTPVEEVLKTGDGLQKAEIV